MAPLRLILGSKNFSSWSLRPWLALRQAGIPFDETVVLFETPGWRDSIRDLSPSGKVPSLRHGDLVLSESLAICEYVAELHPQANLWPADAVARAVARAVSCEMHAGFGNLRKDLYMDVTMHAPKETLSAETRADIERVRAIWEDCRTRFGSSSAGPFLFGAFSIADAMFAPVVWRFRTWGVAVVPPAARAWYEAMLALPAMKEWEEAAQAEVRARTVPLTPPDPRSAQHVFAVVFSSQLIPSAAAEYGPTADAMVELAKKQPGFLGIEAARGTDGFGITVSYWESLEAIAAWKANAEHRSVQERGKSHFYERYSLRVCSVERSYGKP